jgi:hypothetical protein
MWRERNGHHDFHDLVVHLNRVDAIHVECNFRAVAYLKSLSLVTLRTGVVRVGFHVDRHEEGQIIDLDTVTPVSVQRDP